MFPSVARSRFCVTMPERVHGENHREDQTDSCLSRFSKSPFPGSAVASRCDRRWTTQPEHTNHRFLQ